MQTKTLADEEPTVVVPVVVEIVHVQNTDAVVHVEVQHVAVTVDLGDRASPICKMSSAPPPVEYSSGCIEFGSNSSLTFHTKYIHGDAADARWVCSRHIPF